MYKLDEKKSMNFLNRDTHFIVAHSLLRNLHLLGDDFEVRREAMPSREYLLFLLFEKMITKLMEKT